jgi:hypothetical protein
MPGRASAFSHALLRALAVAGALAERARRGECAGRVGGRVQRRAQRFTLDAVANRVRTPRRLARGRYRLHGGPGGDALIDLFDEGSRDTLICGGGEDIAERDRGEALLGCSVGSDDALATLSITSPSTEAA